MEGSGEMFKGQKASIFDLKDDKVPDGLRYHVIDVWVDGMMECEDWDSQKDPLLEQIEKVAKEGKTRTLRARANAALDDPRLEESKEGEDDQDDGFEGFESE